MRQVFRKFAWYPPAETKIPLSAFWTALFSQGHGFRKALCNYLHVDRVVLGESGRGLLYSLLSTLKRRNPDRIEVLIPGYTCYSVAASVAKADLRVRAYDMDPGTLAPDLNSLKQALSNNTLAIVVQHLFGIPTALDECKEIADGTGAVLIEDAAQALGGSIGDRLLGTMADFGFYSFGRGKALPLGSGGALVGKDGGVLEAISLRQGGAGFLQLLLSATTQILSKPPLYWLPEKLPLGLGETVFDLNFDTSTMSSLIERSGEKSLGILKDLNAHRRRLAGIYNDILENRFLIPTAKPGEPVYTRFPLIAGSGPIPDALYYLGARRMYPNAIIDVESIGPFLAEHQVSTPGAAYLAENLVTLPTHTGITKRVAEEIASLIDGIRSWN